VHKPLFRSAAWLAQASALQNTASKQNGSYRQGNYALADVFTHWAMTDTLQLSLNVNNLSYEKYLTSLYEVGYYAAGRTANISLDMSF
jgi:outer membrane receptor for ferric coprogen and ferric-rhodotorulic acid